MANGLQNTKLKFYRFTFKDISNEEVKPTEFER